MSPLMDPTHHDTGSIVPLASDAHATANTVQDSIPIQEQLAEAHQQTGWNQVHTQYGLSGKGQTVAVIDSGIAYDHVALGGGYGAGYRVVGGWDFAENDANPYDDAPAGFHGTHVSGIIGANDGTHLGVASDVDLVSLRVFNDQGKGELSWAESALQWVHQHRFDFANPITTVNLSLGSSVNSTDVPSWGSLENELAQLQQDGIVVVASAGNAFQQYKATGLSYPASSPYVIPVGSIDASGQLSDFSQRDSRIIAAPGRNIESTVPDFFYGRDGDPNDWATASGTSMAAPYVAGASVLVREAMEMAGIQNITSQSIYQALKSSAHAVWDSATQQSYGSLDLDQAIRNILPADYVGDSLSTGQLQTIQSSWHTDGMINSLSDHDVYRLAPTHNGTVSVQFDSHYVSDAVFTLNRNGVETTVALDHGKLNIPVTAGEVIGLSISDSHSIGSYQLQWGYVAAAEGGGTSGGTLPTHTVDLGHVDDFSQSLSSDSKYHVTASHTGLMSIVVDANGSSSGVLQAFRSSSLQRFADSTLENGQWRLDIAVTEGEGIDFVLPSSSAHNVHVMNLVQQTTNQLTVFGSVGQDDVRLDMSNGWKLTVNGVPYSIDGSSIRTVSMDGAQNADDLELIGSSLADAVELRPGLTTLVNTQVSIQANNYEHVHFVGGGGPDRAYLYDVPTDDRLSIWPNKAEMTGVGYSFQVEQVSRIFVHALQGGDDQAFVFDSAGDDTLSVRPQFTSLSGSGYFNYVSGFERVFAYASGGNDQASLYDSAGDDLFNTSGEVTSIVGPGFSTFARGFDSVEGISSAGGHDKARIYAGSSNQVNSGPDYVGFNDGQRASIARTFETVETYIGGSTVPNSVFRQSLVNATSHAVAGQSISSQSIEVENVAEGEANDASVSDSHPGHIDSIAVRPSSHAAQLNFQSSDSSSGALDHTDAFDPVNAAYDVHSLFRSAVLDSKTDSNSRG